MAIVLHRILSLQVRAIQSEEILEGEQEGCNPPVDGVSADQSDRVVFPDAARARLKALP